MSVHFLFISYTCIYLPDFPSKWRHSHKPKLHSQNECEGVREYLREIETINMQNNIHFQQHVEDIEANRQHQAFRTTTIVLVVRNFAWCHKFKPLLLLTVSFKKTNTNRSHNLKNKEKPNAILAPLVHCTHYRLVSICIFRSLVLYQTFKHKP